MGAVSNGLGLRDMNHEEFVPGGVAIYQPSDRCQIYQCPSCRMSVFTQYEGDDPCVGIECHGFLRGHTVRWEDPVTFKLKTGTAGVQ